MKVMLAGIGAWGKNHLRTLYSLKGVDELVVVDKDEEKLKKALLAYPRIKTSTDFDASLKQVDSVVIATNAKLHYELAKKSLSFGLPTFVEKPLTLTTAHAKELVDIADRKSITLMVGHLLLYHEGAKKLKDIIQSGELGKVYYMYFQRVNLGRVRRDENVVFSLAPHDVSLALYFIDNKPLSVKATGMAFVQKEKGIEDVAFMDIMLADNIAVHIHVSWLDPHKVRLIKIVGTEKMAVFDDMAQEEKLKIYDKGIDWDLFGENTLYASSVAVRYGDIYSPRIKSSEPLKNELGHFVNCVENNLVPLTDGKSAIPVVAVLEAATMSMRQNGTKIQLKEL